MIHYNTFILLLITVVSLWFNSGISLFGFITFRFVNYWQLFMLFTIISALYADSITFVGLISLIVFYLMLYQFRYNAYKIIKNNHLIVLFWLLIIIFAGLFYLHKVPGFHNYLIWNKVKFTADAVPFTMYLNLDKTLVGIMIIGMALSLNRSLVAWRFTFRSVVIFFPIVAIVLLFLSHRFNYVKFEPKLVDGIILWSINNLFFVCMAEEALFRGFIQNGLSKLKYRYAGIMSIFITAILFGLLHAPGGIKYVALATIAGILYGTIYYKTKRIEVSILTHFLVNLVHILFFTYPALENSIK